MFYNLCRVKWGKSNRGASVTTAYHSTDKIILDLNTIISCYLDLPLLYLALRMHIKYVQVIVLECLKKAYISTPSASADLKL